ncbi:MAG: histidine kinase [candidate division WOR-3 bacterium]
MAKKSLTVRGIFWQSLFLLALVVVLSLGFFFYRYASHLLVLRILDSAEKLAVSISGQLDLEIRKMDTVSINVSYSNLVRDHFTDYLGEIDNPVLRYRHSRLLMDVFMAISGPFLTVQQVNLYDLNGNMVGAGFFNSTARVALEESPWYQKTMLLEGRKYISDPYSSTLFPGSAYKNRFFISLYRVYFNNFGEKIGIIETVRDYDSVFAALERVVDSGSSRMEVCVFDGEGRIIYPLGQISDAWNLMKDAVHQREGTVGSLVLDVDPKGRRLLAYARSEYTGWTVLLAQPAAIAMLPISQLTKLVLAVVAGILCLSFLLSFVIADRITGPIRRLDRIIGGTHLETLSETTVQAPEGNIREIKDLYQTFSAMRLKLKESMENLLLAREKEMEAKFLALQSQINPHFLRNCLTNISIMAEEGATEAVISMCQNISHMLYYTYTPGPSMVKLETEMDYVRRYLECIKLRYGASLQYEIAMEEGVNSVMVPKLLIQPLVENAVEHGTNGDPPWVIRVHGMIVDRFWRVSVEDSGPGFDAEILSMLRQKVNWFREQKRASDIVCGDARIGLWNVFLRLYLTYGDGAIFEVKNKSDGGAVVVVGGTLGKEGNL